MKSSLILGGIASLLFGVQAAPASSGFIDSCSERGDWYVDAQGGIISIVASCSSRSGEWVTSRLNLDYCLANDNGGIQGRSRGNFAGSCFGCSAIYNDSPIILRPGERPDTSRDITSSLACECLKADKTVNFATIDLNNIIGNINGYLECFGREGDRVWLP